MTEERGTARWARIETLAEGAGALVKQLADEVSALACYRSPMTQPVSAPLVEHLTEPRPIVFPTEAPVPENKAHLDLRESLGFVLRRVLGATAWVGSEQLVYFDASDPSKSLAPDLFVRRGGPHEEVASWKVWERGAPEVAIEIVSASDAEPDAWEEKLSKYHALGIVELMRFDLEATPCLRMWDRAEGDLVERRLHGSRATSQLLGLDLVVVGRVLRWERDGAILKTGDELAAEAVRASQQTTRVDATLVHAALEAERAERLRAKLVAAGIDPED